MTADVRNNALELVRERLNEEAFAHSVRVAQTCEQLALIYGIDLESAWLAGLLHDWDKDLSDEQVAQSARRHGLSLDPVEEAVPHLLHAATGARSVREAVPELSGEIVNAIAHHTLGHPSMSELDMVVFVSDMLEPGRRFSGADTLRESVGAVGLRQLFALCYQHTFEHLLASRRLIHPMAVQVWNSLVATKEPTEGAHGYS